MNGLDAGQYNIRFQCKTCVWGDPHVETADIILSGSSEKNLKRTFSKRELVAGAGFALRLDRGIGDLSGQVTQTVP